MLLDGKGDIVGVLLEDGNGETVDVSFEDGKGDTVGVLLDDGKGDTVGVLLDDGKGEIVGFLVEVWGTDGDEISSREIEFAVFFIPADGLRFEILEISPFSISSSDMCFEFLKTIFSFSNNSFLCSLDFI